MIFWYNISRPSLFVARACLLELTDQERRLIELLRRLYCADVHIHVERGILSARGKVEQSVLLDKPPAGQFLDIDKDY